MPCLQQSWPQRNGWAAGHGTQAQRPAPARRGRADHARDLDALQAAARAAEVGGPAGPVQGRRGEGSRVRAGAGCMPCTGSLLHLSRCRCAGPSLIAPTTRSCSSWPTWSASSSTCGRTASCHPQRQLRLPRCRRLHQGVDRTCRSLYPPVHSARPSTVPSATLSPHALARALAEGPVHAGLGRQTARTSPAASAHAHLLGLCPHLRSGRTRCAPRCRSCLCLCHALPRSSSASSDFPQELVHLAAA